MSKEEKKLKMAVISGASHALRYKREVKYTTDEEIIQRVSRESNEIINKLDTEE